MTAITEWLLLRRSATTDGNGGSTTEIKHRALRIPNLKALAFYSNRAIVFNCQRYLVVTHTIVPLRMLGL